MSQAKLNPSAPVEPTVPQPSLSEAELQACIDLFTELSADSRRVIVRLMQSMLGRPRPTSAPAQPPPPPVPAPCNPSLGMVTLPVIVALLLLAVWLWLSGKIGLCLPL
jgi:hypothetical protein